jgi:hypothetical protein
MGNCEQAQSSSQLSVVSLLLLVDRFESGDLVLRFLELLSRVGRSLANSGDKPKGRGAEGGSDGWVKGEQWVESEEGFSRSWRDWWVLILLEFDEAGDGVFVLSPFLIGSDEGEWEGGSCRMRCNLLNGCWFGRAWDIWCVRRRAVSGVRRGRAGHLVRDVSSAARVSAIVFVFETVGVRNMAEGGPRQPEASLANCGTKTG